MKRSGFLFRSHSGPEDIKGFQTGVLFIPAALFVIAGALAPLIVIGVFSFARFDYGFLTYDWNIDHYRRFFTEPTYYRSLITSTVFVGAASILAVVVTIPFAYFVATKIPPDRQPLWLAGSIIPFFTSYLARVIGVTNFFGDQGVINYVLTRTGLLSEPLQALDFGRSAIVVTFVYLQSPIIVLMTFVAIKRIDGTLRAAAADLGARPIIAFALVSLPLMTAGLANGLLYAFVSMIGDYITPVLVGGSSGFMFISILMNQFGPSLQWDFGAALAVALLVVILTMLALVSIVGSGTSQSSQPSRTDERPSFALNVYAVGFLAFQYAPVFVLLLFSLNAADFVGFPITGLSLRWFASLLRNDSLLAAFGLSIKVAALSATFAVVLGGLAGISIARASRRYRLIAFSTIALPLLLPPVILGIGIIMTMAAIDAPSGWWRIAFAHTLLAVPVVAMVVIAQLQGMGSEAENAAMDLGATPRRAFLEITLPRLAPALLAGGFLAFALSMDEFIVTFLVTGNDATLPIYVYSSIRFRMSPEIVAASAVQIALSFIVIIISIRLLKLRGLVRAATAPN